MMLTNVHVARSTRGRAGAGGAELRQRTGEQVDVLEKRNRWRKSIRGKLNLAHPIAAVCSRREKKQVLCKFNGVYSLLLASHSAWSTPGGSDMRANMSKCAIRWHMYCCWRYGRSSRLLLLIPLGWTAQS